MLSLLPLQSDIASSPFDMMTSHVISVVALFFCLLRYLLQGRGSNIRLGGGGGRKLRACYFIMALSSITIVSRIGGSSEL